MESILSPLPHSSAVNPAKNVILVFMRKVDLFDELVYTKFILYKSLFSNLPYDDIREIATYLPVFRKACGEGLAKGKSPALIVEKFFKEHQSGIAQRPKENLLFKFIQFIERQIVLFDALEDAAFMHFHDESGKGTLNELFTMAASHQKEKVLSAELKKFRLKLVLTAHPTQFYTEQTLAIITDLTELFKVNDIPQINRLLLQLSKTPFFKKDKPTPFQEAERLTWYLRNIFYDAIPKLQERISTYIETQENKIVDIHPVQIGFWPGGDRDGNPYVTHQTTLQTATLLRISILKSYRQDVRKLRRQLTFRKVDELIENIFEKLNATIHHPEEKNRFRQPEELCEALEEILNILLNESEGIYANEVKALLTKIKLFGFHFVSMDIRQNSGMHETAVLDLLNTIRLAKDYQSANINQRLKILSNAVIEDFSDISATTTEVLETLRCIRTIQKQNGEAALHRYIISNCSDISDLAEVTFLFRAAGFKSSLPVDIVPLFETIDDLQRASATMRLLYSDKTYRAHLKSRGNRQTVMLGFSDGTKDGGYLTANWSIYKAKQAITNVSKTAGIHVAFFDGRGGPAARGGGKAHLFYASMDDTIAMDEIQLTIQGQTISANFGIPPAAISNMEQLLHGGIAGKLFFSKKNKLSKKQFVLLEELSAISFAEYVQLKNNKLFLSYLEKFTPIKYLGSANIASRPTSRNEGKLRYEDLRAITFVGAWYQIKQNVPGFYGLGTALKKIAAQGRIEEVKSLYEKSLFFKALIDNSMMALTKTNFNLTQYLQEDKVYGKLWSKIHDEYDDCLRLLPEITGMKSLMEHDSVSHKSITIREELVVPLAVIQQFALQQLNRTEIRESQKSLFEKIIIRTLYGMTNAGRNSV